MVKFWVDRLLAASAVDPGGSHRSSRPDRHAARLPPTKGCKAQRILANNAPIRSRCILRTKWPQKSIRMLVYLRRIAKHVAYLNCTACTAPGDQEFLPEVWRMHSMPHCSGQLGILDCRCPRRLLRNSGFGWLRSELSGAGWMITRSNLLRSVETRSLGRMIAG